MPRATWPRRRSNRPGRASIFRAPHSELPRVGSFLRDNPMGLAPGNGSCSSPSAERRRMFLRCAQSVRADRLSSGFEFSPGVSNRRSGWRAEAMPLPSFDRFWTAGDVCSPARNRATCTRPEPALSEIERVPAPRGHSPSEAMSRNTRRSFPETPSCLPAVPLPRRSNPMCKLERRRRNRCNQRGRHKPVSPPRTAARLSWEDAVGRADVHAKLVLDASVGDYIGHECFS